MQQAQQRPPAPQAHPGSTHGPSSQLSAAQGPQQGRSPVPGGLMATPELVAALQQAQHSLQAARLSGQSLQQASGSGGYNVSAGSLSSQHSGPSGGDQGPG